jgi:hypothetical protein
MRALYGTARAACPVRSVAVARPELAVRCRSYQKKHCNALSHLAGPDDGPGACSGVRAAVWSAVHLYSGLLACDADVCGLGLT